MTKKFDTLKPEQDLQSTGNQTVRRERAREALRRLRQIGEDLPSVDAVAVVRESRDMAEQGAR
ncbi:MAG: hypothetical protein H0T92_09420 [Pyrinomonadaceae bacterium]|jgi:hypothetical protein|nr:hypothetical protein [Pyrinomonadaceae bacterium]